MNILYGVCSEGIGHSSRALVIGKFLEKKRHKLIILAEGQSYDVLADKFKVMPIHGMHLVFNNGILNKRKTFYKGIKIFTKNLLKMKSFNKLIKNFKPDLCICDMEPVVSMLANFYRIPLISIDNQHLLTNFDINIPKKYKLDFSLTKLMINIFSIGSLYSIVTGFGNEKAIKKDTFLVYPIVREEVLRLKPKYGKKILVYLNQQSKETDEKIINLLKTIDQDFVVFGFNINKADKNLKFKTKEFFLKELKDCKAIIGTAGFSLISEAVYLKKPYFALPLKGQIEQVFNAFLLKDSGFGDYSELLEEKYFINFLKNLDKYREKMSKYNPDYNKLFSVLEEVLTKISSR